MKKSKLNLTTLIFVVGFLILCAPLVMNFIQGQHQKDAVSAYKSSVSNKSAEEIQKLLTEAEEYNNMLFQSNSAVVDNLDTSVLSDESYNSLLDQSNGIMGSIEIPKIDVDLPIYHGTSDEVLEVGIGHIQGTSLPIGGENTHCVLSGHRGLPGSKLFTRLDEMEEGDLFFLQVLGETLAYKVYNIQVVEPDDVSVMEIQAGRDDCSLITCTPYGLNTHRLVVTGERVPYEKAQYDSIDGQLPSIREILFMVIPFVLLGTGIALKIRDRRRQKHEKQA